MASTLTCFEALLERRGIAAPLRVRLGRYGALVLEANRSLNLTGAKSADEFADHLVDSLTLLPYIRSPYVDVGSGAGLPAVPIAIATEIRVTMIEATAKKARFLTSLLDSLAVRGEVIAERAEIAGHRHGVREQFSSGTARALGSAPTVAELLLPLLAVGGLAVVQRGLMADGERAALQDASLMLGGSVEDEIELGRGRRIILVRKLSSTPSRFPRRTGTPGKRPLCF